MNGAQSRAPRFRLRHAPPLCPAASCAALNLAQASPNFRDAARNSPRRRLSNLLALPRDQGMGHVMRILLAGLLGAIAMYVWMSVAHMATPLAMMGVSHLSTEQPVMDAIHSDLGDKSGFYLYPWSEDMSAEGMKAQQARVDANGAGLIVYRAPG